MFVSHNQILSKLKENDIPRIDKSKFFLLTSPWNSQNLSFPTRDGTKATAVKAGTLTTGLPENSFIVISYLYIWAFSFFSLITLASSFSLCFGNFFQKTLKTNSFNNYCYSSLNPNKIMIHRAKPILGCKFRHSASSFIHIFFFPSYFSLLPPHIVDSHWAVKQTPNFWHVLLLSQSLPCSFCNNWFSWPKLLLDN